MIIGITGRSGSGKTTACEIFKELGAYVINADKIGHEILSSGSQGLSEAVKAFGVCILNSDKSLNRRMLGEIVFNDKSKLAILNSITLNKIEEKILNEIEQIKDKLIVIDAAILPDSKLINICDEVLLIESDNLLERILKRDKIDENQAKSRLNSQKDDNYYRNKATIIIKNNSSIENFKSEIEKLYINWTEE